MKQNELNRPEFALDRAHFRAIRDELGERLRFFYRDLPDQPARLKTVAARLDELSIDQSVVR